MSHIVTIKTQVHDALAYYYDNRKEIDKDIAENTEDVARKKFSH